MEEEIHRQGRDSCAVVRMYCFDSNCFIGRVIAMIATAIRKTMKARSTHTRKVSNGMEMNVPISLETAGTKKGVIAFVI